MIIAQRQRLFNQLYGRQFSTYFNDNMSVLSSPNGTNQTVSVLVNFNLDTSSTWVFRGYFRATTTSSNWQFRTTSDDASYVWVGANAMPHETNLNTANAIVNNGKLHGSQTVASGTFSLTAGQYYPIVIVGGNNTGAGVLTFQWTTDGTNWDGDGDTIFFRNSKAPNGYNLN